MSNMVVNTNVAALNSHRNMKKVGTTQATAASRLSSGLKINSAADDAAGLAISEKMRSQIRGLDMASKNAQDAISLIQTAEGGMQEIDNMVQRIRELVVYASNDTQDNDAGGLGSQYGDRRKIQDEIEALSAEIDSMADRVEFNKKTLISGKYGEKKDPTDTQLWVTAQMTFEGLRTAATTDVKQAITAVNTAIAAVNTATVGNNTNDSFLTQAKKDLAVAYLNTYKDQLTAVASGIANGLDLSTDTNYTGFNSALAAFATIGADGTAGATLMSGLTAPTAITTSVGAYNAGVPVLASAKSTYDGAPTSTSAALYFQVGANKDQGWKLNISSVKTDALGIGSGNQDANMSVSPNYTINVVKASGDNITGFLETLDTALTKVTTERSKLGAAQNRLDFTIKSLDISSENLSASESRVRDADMGKEMMNLTKANVLQQAAISMLAQNNQNPQMILQLLR